MAFTLLIETLWTKANRGSCPAVATDKCHSKDGLDIIITIRGATRPQMRRTGNFCLAMVELWGGWSRIEARPVLNRLLSSRRLPILAGVYLSRNGHCLVRVDGMG